MDSDESRDSESEFYYPEEETLYQMMPINLFPTSQLYPKRHPKNVMINHKYMLFTRLGWSIWGKTVPLVLSTLQPRAVLKTLIITVVHTISSCEIKA